MAITSRISGAIAALLGGVFAGSALADNLDGKEIIGVPVPGGTGFQPAATSLARELQWLDGFLLVIITVICLFVTALLAWCVVRFNAKANPKPALFSHNTPIEVTWTLVPVVILVVIGFFSLPVLFKQQDHPRRQTSPSRPPVTNGTGATSIPSMSLASTVSCWAKARMEDLRLHPGRVSSCHGYSHGRAGRTRPLSFRSLPPTLSTAWTIPAFGVKQDGVPGRIWPNFGSRPRKKASTSASAPSFAAKTTPTCRSPLRWLARRSTKPGSTRAIAEYAG